ncbi:NAD(P)-dependent oxidoreductase [Microbacterium sp. ZW T5_56]|uniref:NAD(P)-dependent oxidoreductase n=1 Tax=Microbacterium sp. ZW T5_56 TaxID=3378081 RepID=UPI003854A4F9
MSSTIVFIGLGAIGLPMAQSIARAGSPVLGVEPSPEGRERAAAAGISCVASLADAGEVGTVVVMVATAGQLSAVADTALTTESVAGSRWIVMSTVGPDAVRREAKRLVEAGARVVDAPVSGGVGRAATGELALFVSGTDDDIAAVRSVLDAMGSPRVVGDTVGDGQAVKVVNQHLCAVHIVAAAEALALAEGLGLDPGFVLDVVADGAAQSFMLGDRGPRMLQGAEAPVRSQVGIFVKDTGLVADAAVAAGVSLPVLEAARDRFLLADAAGLRTRDDSSVIETYRTVVA